MAQAVTQLRAELWDDTDLDAFNVLDRKATDQILKAFVHFLADCLVGEMKGAHFGDLNAFIAALTESASHYGVAIEAGTQAAFMLRAHAPGISDDTAVFGEIFTFGSQWHRPQKDHNSIHLGHSALRFAPFSILITLTERSRNSKDPLGGSIKVTHGLTAKIVALRFPL